MSNCESPKITELGSVADFTQGEGWRGDHDSITFTIWGYDIDVSWGQPPSS